MTDGRDARKQAEEIAAALAGFFRDVSPRLHEELRDSGALAGAAGDARREWEAVALHAVVRGVVSAGAPVDDVADVVDAMHDRLLASLAGGEEPAALRARLAERYHEYDGVTRTLGKAGAAGVPAAIAAACARHVGPRDGERLAATLAPLLEALAEGAAATLAEASVREPELPPEAPLRRLTSRLDAAGYAWAVGGSALLAALGLLERVNDWDVQVDAAPELLQWLFATVPHSFHGHGGCHADWKLSFEEERTELIPCFAFYAPGGIVNVPLRVSVHWRGLPIASPEGWACAYWLMGEYDAPSLRARRRERAELLFAHLARHGADAGRVRELLAEPLPGALAEKLEALARG